MAVAQKARQATGRQFRSGLSAHGRRDTWYPTDDVVAVLKAHNILDKALAVSEISGRLRRPSILRRQKVAGPRLISKVLLRWVDARRRVLMRAGALMIMTRLSNCESVQYDPYTLPGAFPRPGRFSVTVTPCLCLKPDALVQLVEYVGAITSMPLSMAVWSAKNMPKWRSSPSCWQRGCDASGC